MNWILLRLGDLTSVLPMTMKHLFASGITILTCSVTTLADVSVKPAGMRIVWDSPSEEPNFDTYHSNEGVNLCFSLNSDGEKIIGYRVGDSDVTVKVGGQNLGVKFQSWEKISKDGKSMKLEVATDKLPERKAGKFKVSGSIKVLLASKKETKSTEVKAFKEGDKVTFGDDFAFKIIGLSKPTFGDYELDVVLVWKHDISALAEVRFYDEDGKLIESRQGGGGGHGEPVVVRSYSLKKKPEAFKIEMDLWEDIEMVTVPLKMNLGLSGVE